MFDLNDGPVIRINQAGYAEGLPVYAAILTKGTLDIIVGSRSHLGIAKVYQVRIP